MNEKQLKERARRHHPKVPYLRHALTAFVSGGLVGVLGQGLLVTYQSVFRMQESDALQQLECFLGHGNTSSGTNGPGQ